MTGWRCAKTTLAKGYLRDGPARGDKAMTGVLFICAGNVFRSMSAEYGLRAALGADAGVDVASAGLEAGTHQVAGFVRDHLAARGLDIARHVPRRLSEDMLRGADLAVAMGAAHQVQILDKYGMRLPLFSEVAYDEVNPLPDVWEAVPDWRNNLDKAVPYAQEVIDYICDGMAGFVARGLGEERPFNTGGGAG